MLTQVNFYGVLGKKYGRTWRLDVQNPAEVVRAMEALRPGFKQFVLSIKGVGFGIRVGKNQCGEARLTFPNNGKRISITPIIRGSAGKGWIQIIAGVVLVAAGIYFENPQLILMGAALILGGIAALLSPTPKTQNTDNKQASYLMGGSVNVTAQGACVPAFYGGPGFIGSVVLSGGIESFDITSGSTVGDGGGSGGGGGGVRTGGSLPVALA